MCVGVVGIVVERSLEQEYQIKDYFALNGEKNSKRVQQKNGEVKLKPPWSY